MNVSPDKQAAHNESRLHVGETAEDFALVPYDTDLLQSQDINQLSLELTGFVEGAPGFSLDSSDGTLIKLAEELKLHRVLLYFYPADFAPNSTRDLRKLGELQAELVSSDIKIYGVSGKLVEGFATLTEQQRKFQDEFALQIPLLADQGLAVARAYGCAPNGGEYPQRTMVLIDQDGQVLAYSRLMLTADKLREALAAKSTSVPPAEPDTVTPEIAGDQPDPETTTEPSEVSEQETAVSAQDAG